MNPYRLDIDGVYIVVTHKRVRNFRLVVNPDGQVRASVPRHVSVDETVDFLRDRIDWVRRTQAKMAARAPVPRPLADGGTVRVWGDEVPLHVVAGRPRTTLSTDGLTIRVADPHDQAAIAAAVATLYRRETRAVLGDLISKWTAVLPRGPSRVVLRTMRTRWGSCTPVSGAIRINPELAARHPRCLNYVVLHELVHLTQPGHGPAFCAVMDAHLPGWRAIRAELNGRR